VCDIFFVLNSGLHYYIELFKDVMQEKLSDDKHFWFFIVVFLFSFSLLCWLIKPFLSIIIMASVITGIFKPVYNILNKKISRSLASFVTCILLFFVLFMPIVFCVSILSKEAYDLYFIGRNVVISDHVKSIFESSEILDKVNLFLENFGIEISAKQLNEMVSNIGRGVGLFLYNQASLIASNVFEFLLSFFFMLLVVYFLMIDGDKFIKYIIDIFPLPQEQGEMLIQQFKDMSGAILIGNGLGGIIQGISGGLVFMFFGFKSPFLWGVIMSLLAFFPIVGIGTVFIPAGIYLLLNEAILSGIFFIIFYIMLSGFVEYIFKPKLVGKRVKMHTLVVFFSIVGGLNLFGILGIIYGPLVITAFLTLAGIYRSNYQKHIISDKITPQSQKQ